MHPFPSPSWITRPANRKFCCARAMAALALYCTRNNRTTYLRHCPKQTKNSVKPIQQCCSL